MFQFTNSSFCVKWGYQKVCVFIWGCVRKRDVVEWVALRWPFLFSLCFPVLSLAPSRHCVLHQPPSIPQSFEKVGALFLFFCYSFVSENFSLLKQRETKKEEKKVSGSEVKWYFSPKWRELISLKLLRWWSGLPTQQSALTALWGLVCRTFGIAFTPRSMFSAWYDLVVMETHELED